MKKKGTDHKDLRLNYRVRPLERTDVPFLWEMLYQAIYVPPGELPPERSILEQPELAHYVQGWGRAGDLGSVAEAQDGSLLGAAWLRLFRATDPGYGYVDDATPELSIALLPAARHQGLGTCLLVDLLREAHQAGYLAVSLSVSPDNPARRLYERLGFVFVGRSGGSWIMQIILEE